MLGFMDYVQQAFSSASFWNRDNSYGALTATARGAHAWSYPSDCTDRCLALLEFPTPNGLSLNLSSLSSPNFATSYSLSSVGMLDGSLSYLYSSLPLNIASKSNDIPLRHIVSGYRQLQELRRPDEPWWWEVWHDGKRIDKRDTLLYGRLYLPASHLEALYLRRISPISQLKISCVSSSQLKSGGSVLFLLSRDFGKYSTEYLYSTDSALLGVRGLYNFGPDPRNAEGGSGNDETVGREVAGLNGRFSAGAELYYGLLNKSGGISTGIRFATLPRHQGFPYTMTLTLNPLMGNLSSTYAVKAGPSLALCSKFDFNVYSYESTFQAGMELWRRRRRSDDLDWAFRKLQEPGKSGWGEPMLRSSQEAPIRESTTFSPGLGGSVIGFDSEDAAGVLKARMNQQGEVGLLWEGKIKELVYSFGVRLEFKQRDQLLKGIGLEIQYSS